MNREQIKMTEVSRPSEERGVTAHNLETSRREFHGFDRRARMRGRRSARATISSEGPSVAGSTRIVSRSIP